MAAEIVTAVASIFGAGEMADRTRAFEWSRTAVGPVRAWPGCLRNAVNMLLSSKAQVILFWGRDFTVFYNDPYRAVFGGKHPRMLGRPGSEAWAEIWTLMLHALLQQVVDTGEAFAARDLLFPIERNGYPEDTYFDISYDPVRGENGAVEGVYCVVTETTKRVLNERRIGLLKDLGTALLTVVSPGEAQERAIDVLAKPGSDISFAQIRLGPALLASTGDALAFEETSPEAIHKLPLSNKSDGDLMLVIGVNPRVPYNDGHRTFLELLANQLAQAISAASDITERKAAEAALRELAETLEQRVSQEIGRRALVENALRQAQKMEAIGQLTGGIAHDFNNLLGAIGGSFSMIERRVAEGDHSIERYIRAGIDSTRRASSLTQRLLAFSRQQTLDAQPVDPNRLVDGMIELVRRTVGPAIAVTVQLGGDIWNTKIDASQLESSLLNLCINARDAMMPHGGALTIATATGTVIEGASQHDDAYPGDYVTISVNDTGSGIPPDVIERVFEPFFTTKPLGQGTGLGLSMVYGFVRQSGGFVRITSAPNAGTNVTLFLPRHDGPAPADAPARDKVVPAHGTGESIVVVDDEPSLRMLMIDVLSDAGYQVEGAADGQAGLQLLDRLANVQLLITDVGLPGGMNGRQVADIVRRKRPELKVLFITGFAETAVVGYEHLEAGMEILTKPFDLSAFTSKVREMLSVPL